MSLMYDTSLSHECSCKAFLCMVVTQLAFSSNLFKNLTSSPVVQRLHNSSFLKQRKENDLGSIPQTLQPTISHSNNNKNEDNALLASFE